MKRSLFAEISKFNDFGQLVDGAVRNDVGRRRAKLLCCTNAIARTPSSKSREAFNSIPELLLVRTFKFLNFCESVVVRFCTTSSPIGSMADLAAYVVSTSGLILAR